MTFFEYLIGSGVLLIFFVAIIVMLAVNYHLVADARVEEERERALRQSRIEAERRYRSMVKNTVYHVYRAPVTFVNETDLDWGSDKEVRI